MEDINFTEVNPQRVEDVMRKLHTYFAKCQPVKGTPDQIIVSKQDMLGLLESLNEAVYDVLDQYEATRRSKEKARLAFEMEAAKIIADAKMEADNVQAASLLYTDTWLEEIKEQINATKASIRNEYIDMMAAMDKRCEDINLNKDSVKERMSEIHDSGKYLEVLHDFREKAAKRAEALAAGLEEEEEAQESVPAKQDYVIKVNRPGENTGVTFTKRRDRNKKKDLAESAVPINTPADPDAVDPDTLPYGTTFSADQFDLDREYFEWKDEQEGEGTKKAPEKKKGFFSRKK